MREILFRGKRVDNGELIISDSIMQLYGGSKVYFYCNVMWIEVIPKIVGQYTGLTDNNGKKIFEGDIIRGTIVSQWSKREIVCEVVYERDTFISKEYNGDFHKLMFAKDIEIIGNIHDNLETTELN